MVTAIWTIALSLLFVSLSKNIFIVRTGGSEKIVVTPTMTPTPTATPTPRPLDITTSDMGAAINKIRAEHGLYPLVELTHLDQGAYTRAVTIKSSGQWSHDDYVPSIKNVLWYAPPAGDKHLGENLARHQKTVDELMRDWMNSPLHRANMLHAEYTYMGVAHYEDYWVLWFTGNP